jgi:quinol-cytochrome oxidoreductase complex cytochrome b subunit/mono/diheme cytochrome c family protein
MHAVRETPSQEGFWRQRTGWTVFKQVMFLEPLPGGSRWAAAFGSLLLFAFVLQVVTGVLLSMNYAPSVDSAWPSVKFIQEEVPLGALVRALHHWGSSAMVILLLLHLLQVFAWGAYKKPRELTWMVGVLLLFCTLGLAFTGYLLPWDQKAYWATKVGLGIASTTPLIGDSLRTLLQGGPDMGNLTLTRFFSIHTFVLPGLLILLVVIHLYLFRLHGVTPGWWQSAEQLRAEEEPFWPKQLLKDSVVWLVFLVALGWWCYDRPAPLEAQADPSQPYEARPEWYFMFLFQLLRHFHGPYEIVGTFVLPTLFFLVLFFWPLLDRSPYRNPLRRPVAIGLLGLGTAGLISLTIFAIASDVRMTEPEQVVAKAPPPAKSAGPIQRADVARIYNDNCAACHGVDGSGKQLRDGMPTIPDLTSLAWQLSQTDLEITHRIQDGNEPLMPAYGDKLSQQQILALTVYVRAFAVAPPEVVQGKVVAGTAAQPPPPMTAGMPPVELYRAYCLACHDADGSGRVARKTMPSLPDLRDAKWQAAHSDAEFRKSMLDGKGKFMRPAKNKLGPSDADKLVAYVRAFQGGKQIIQVEPQPPIVRFPPTQPTIVAGSKASPTKPRSPTVPSAELAARTRVAAGLYRQYCLSCHAADGTGSEMKDGMPTIPDFSSAAWQASVSNAQLVVSILDGKGTQMPAFRERVSDDQAQDLAAYVRSFGPATPSSAMPASDFEKQFADVQAHWRELQRQLQELSKTSRQPAELYRPR